MEKILEEKKVTGILFYYYFVCKRKMWYFYNEITMENNNENVQLGKLLDEVSYSRVEKHICIDETINIDFIKDYKVIHEVKKSRKIEEACEWQVKYYIYYLKNKGVNGVTGQLDYPLLKKTKIIELTEADEVKIGEILDDIDKIVMNPIPPLYCKKNICKSCAYFDLCGI